MALTLLPVSAMAEGAEAPTGGEPTPVETKTGNVTYSDNNAKIGNLVYTNGTMTVTGANVTIENVTFGDNAALVVNTTGDFTLTNCKFAPNTEYDKDENVGVRTAVYLKVGGTATVTNNTFEGVDNGYYNAIEFGIGNDHSLKNATISGNTFTKAIKNNYFNFYNMQVGAVIDITNNQFLLANKSSNGIRISNNKNVSATFNLDSNTYTYAATSADSMYEGLILLQDYAGQNAVQDFKKIVINITNLTAPEDAKQILYVYDDQDGIIQTNQPVVKGDSSIEKFFAAKVGDTYYKTLPEAVAAANEGNTITLLKDTTVGAANTSNFWVNKSIKLDLNTHTITGAYQLALGVNNENAVVTVENGSLSGGTVSEAYLLKGKLIMNNITIDSKATQSAIYNLGGELELNDCNIATTVTGAGGIYDFSTNHKIVIKNSKISAADYWAVYHNGSTGGFVLEATNSEMKSTNVQAVYISGSTVTPDAAGKNQQATFTGCTITGKTGIEGKFTDITLNDCVVTATAKTPTFEQYNNGSTTEGFAIVSTDNTMNPASPAPTATVKINGGKYAGLVGLSQLVTTTEYPDFKEATYTITGGYFTSDPSSYKAADRYVVASDVDGYTYMVTATAPTDDQKITVVDKTNASVDPSITGNDKTAIDSAMNSGKTNVDGVAEAVSTTVKTGIVNDAKDKANNVPDGEVTSTEIEVKVNVSVTEANLSEGSMTFKAEPVANVKVNGTELRDSEDKPVEVPVSNAMLNGKPITVKLPLPTVDGKLFTPEQIKHISSDGSVEYFLKTAKRGAKLFTVDSDNCAVFTITKFSTFELSGTVTYVEPSYSFGSSSYDPTYSVSTPSKTENGSVTVSPKSASKGDTVTVTVKPDSGYVLETLTVTDKNGNELTLKDKGNGKYTFTMPAGKVEVKATFMEDNSMLNFFYDVPNNAYFYEAVKWAVKNGITTGVGNDLFAPEQPCTRAQIVTFLWRAAGSPEPKGTASGMTDVVSGSYYEKAVAWAIENGITTGTTTSTFSPDATCTRAQAVTFLARALSAKASGKAEFSDVPADSYFADAVAWAAANGVTEGIGGGLFGSDNDCTRGQIVTFLYRAYNK